MQARYLRLIHLAALMLAVSGPAANAKQSSKPGTSAAAMPELRERKSLAKHVGDLMHASVAKSAAGDHAAAVALIAQAEEVVAANADQFDTFWDAVAAADIARVHGDEVRAGTLSDPCPHYRRARKLALKAQDMTANDGEAERREAAADLLGRIDRKAAAAACPAPPAPAPDRAYVGHYYLSGVMETGSELLLRPDGTFEWYLSYGALDQYARGSWVSDGGAVVLTALTPGKDKPLFTYREIEPWSEAAEDEVLNRRYDEADEEVHRRCPFLAGVTALAASPALLPDPDQPKQTPEMLQAEAASALRRALAARSHAEALARAEMARPRADRQTGPAANTSAEEALGAWESARWNAQDAARRAGLPPPQLADAALPAACALSSREAAATIPPTRWTGGVGVRVYDIASEQGARDVKVTLRFADGREARIVTAHRGLALLAGKQASPVVGIGLSADYAPGRDQSLAVPPVTSGVIHVTIDAEQLAAPPFETIRLRIDGAALIPDSMGRGRYERQP